MTLEKPDTTLTCALTGLKDNIERVILGKSAAVTQCIVGLLAEGHILLEDVPGTGKTTLARALARSVHLEFRRIQFTSDLLPADVLGVSMPSPEDGRFVFRPGPIFGNVVLADELNRSTPRTQSALLEAMNEGRASVDGETRDLPRPFLVIATQNPVEFEGTYPLPESQLDRFLLRVRLGYPAREVEHEVLASRLSADPIDELEAVMSAEQLQRAIAAVREVRVDPSLIDYALDIIERTRKSGAFLLGASPRAGIGWMRAAQALAVLEGRDYCLPDDVKQLARPVLTHRVVLTPGFEPDRQSIAHETELRITELVEATPVPA